MATLSLTSDVVVRRGSALYYDQYRYSVRSTLPECWVLRHGFVAADIVSRLRRRQQWRETMRLRWIEDRTTLWDDEITETMIDNLVAMGEFLSRVTVPYKLVVSGRCLRLYTNDPMLLSDLDRLPWLRSTKFAEKSVTQPKDVLLLKNPRNQWRSYFREMRMESSQRQALKRFLDQQGEIRMCSSLTAWLNQPDGAYATRYTREYFFVDYDSQNWPTLLSLVCPRLIRRTLAIQAK